MYRCPKCSYVTNDKYCKYCGCSCEEVSGSVTEKNAVYSNNQEKDGAHTPYDATISARPRRTYFRRNIVLVLMCLIVLGFVSGLFIKLYFDRLEKEFEADLDIVKIKFENCDYESTLSHLNAMKNSRYYKTSDTAFSIEGKSYMELKDYDKAIACFEKANKIRVDEDVTFNLAVCYAKINNSRKALDVLGDAKGKKDVKAYLEAEIFLSVGKSEAAIESFQEVTQISNDHSLKLKAYIEIARVYKDLRHEDKEKYYYLNKQIEVMEEAARELKIEDDITLTEMMGEAYFTAREYELSLIKFRRLIELGYDRAYIYKNIAVIYQQTNRLDDAEEILLEMKDKYPEESQCYVQLAFVYAEKENAKSKDNRDYTKVLKNYELAQKYAVSDNESGLVQLERMISELRSKGWL